MSRRIVHIAAQNTHFRERLNEIVADYTVGDVVISSREGPEGVAAAEAVRPEVIVLASAPEEDISGHVFWYRHACPQARLLGLAFSEVQAADYRGTEVDAVVRSDAGRETFMGAFGGETV